MTIASLAALDEATAFERFALDLTRPLRRALGESSVIDLRGRPSIIGVASVGDGSSRGREELANELRPLLFGAAWRILDLSIEYGLNLVTPQNEWPIAQKARHAQRAVLVPLSQQVNYWDRIAALYGATVEARHSLTHRHFSLSSQGDLTQMVDRVGAPIADVRVDEQEAFIRISQSVVRATLSGAFTQRDAADLIASLDASASIHGLGKIGGGARWQQPILVIMEAQPTHGGSWTVDLASAHSRASQQYVGRYYFDVEIHFPGLGCPPLRGRLEEAPHQSSTAVDPWKPPSWAS